MYRDQARQHTRRTTPELVSEVNLLAAEANHRIANSLALLAASVRNEAEHMAAHPDQLEVDEVLDAMRGIAGRIAAVGQMHRDLAHNPGEVELNAHLAGVCNNVIASAAPGRFRLLQLSSEPCPLETDHLVHLCLIVCEIVTNSIKYSHPSGVDGIITLACRKLEDGRVQVEVGDDGVGLSEDFDPERDGGLGTRTVRALARRLGIETSMVDNAIGLRVRLILPARE